MDSYRTLSESSNASLESEYKAGYTGYTPKYNSMHENPNIRSNVNGEGKRFLYGKGDQNSYGRLTRELNLKRKQPSDDSYSHTNYRPEVSSGVKAKVPTNEYKAYDTASYSSFTKSSNAAPSQWTHTYLHTQPSQQSILVTVNEEQHKTIPCEVCSLRRQNSDKDLKSPEKRNNVNECQEAKKDADRSANEKGIQVAITHTSNDRNHIKRRKRLLILAYGVAIIVISIMASIITSMFYTQHTGPSEVYMDKYLTEYINSESGKAALRSQTVCVQCDKISYEFIELFPEKRENKCCIKDLGEFSTKLSVVLEKNINTKPWLDCNPTKDSNCSGQLLTVVERNGQLLNELLTREKSAVHLTGLMGADDVKWSNVTISGNIQVDNNGNVHIKERGTYFIYGRIRFKRNACSDRGSKLGYEIKMKESNGGQQTLASVQHRCLSHGNDERDLVIQTLAHLDLDQYESKTLYVHVEKSLITHSNVHSFGVFQV